MSVCPPTYVPGSISGVGWPYFGITERIEPDEKMNVIWRKIAVWLGFGNLCRVERSLKQVGYNPMCIQFQSIGNFAEYSRLIRISLCYRLLRLTKKNKLIYKTNIFFKQKIRLDEFKWYSSRSITRRYNFFEGLSYFFVAKLSSNVLLNNSNTLTYYFMARRNQSGSVRCLPANTHPLWGADLPNLGETNKCAISCLVKVMKW